MESRLIRNLTANSTEFWSFAISQDGTTLFDSTSLGVRLTTRQAAEWLSALIEHLIATGVSINDYDLVWSGDLDDDCHFTDEPFRAHAEHLAGPRRAGVWYCAVTDTKGNQRYFHTADFPGIEPKSGAAARKLCLMAMSAARSGFLVAYPS